MNTIVKMNAIVKTQMAAMSAAIRVLLAGDPLAKPAELVIPPAMQ